MHGGATSPPAGAPANLAPTRKDRTRLGRKDRTNGRKDRTGGRKNRTKGRKDPQGAILAAPRSFSVSRSFSQSLSQAAQFSRRPLTILAAPRAHLARK